MNKDIKKSSKGQSKNEKWDKELQELAKKAKSDTYGPYEALTGGVNDFNTG